MLDDPALTEFVVRELAHGQDRNQVIAQLCERTGLRWPEVEAFVQSIEFSEAPVITRRQVPTLLLIIVPTLIAGLVVTAWASYVLVLDARMYDQQFGGALPLGLFALAALHWQTACVILTGMAMITGSGIGLGQIIASYNSR
ncbi:MAG TPA: hypothetical protein VJJ70_06080 [Anaerolineales bacterium]|nr:hypothetical protein [Anaerolineales bacterium]